MPPAWRPSSPSATPRSPRPASTSGAPTSATRARGAMPDALRERHGRRPAARPGRRLRHRGLRDGRRGPRLGRRPAGLRRSSPSTRPASPRGPTSSTGCWPGERGRRAPGPGSGSFQDGAVQRRPEGASPRPPGDTRDARSQSLPRPPRGTAAEARPAPPSGWPSSPRSSRPPWRAAARRRSSWPRLLPRPRAARPPRRHGRHGRSDLDPGIRDPHPPRRRQRDRGGRGGGRALRGDDRGVGRRALRERRRLGDHRLGRRADPDDAVVAAADTTYTILFSDQREATARVVASDEARGLVLLQAEATGLTPARLAASADLAVGELVVAIGSPLGEFTDTVTSGIVSGLGPVRRPPRSRRPAAASPSRASSRPTPPSTPAAAAGRSSTPRGPWSGSSPRRPAAARGSASRSRSRTPRRSSPAPGRDATVGPLGGSRAPAPRRGRPAPRPAPDAPPDPGSPRRRQRDHRRRRARARERGRRSTR